MDVSLKELFEVLDLKQCYFCKTVKSSEYMAYYLKKSSNKEICTCGLCYSETLSVNYALLSYGSKYYPIIQF